MAKKRKSPCRQVAERLYKEVEKGNPFWRESWVAGHFAFNRVSKRIYSTYNQYYLRFQGEDKREEALNENPDCHDYDEIGSGEYATYKEWNDLGGKIKKGQTANKIVFFHFEEKEEEDENGEIVVKVKPSWRYYNVFHISQVEGVEPLPEMEYPNVFVPDGDMDKFISDYLTREKIRLVEEKDGNESYYSPALDKIVVPEKKQFVSTEDFYGTVLHEMVHSTGHAKRLSRLDGKAKFGSGVYSKEELIAEIGSATLLNLFGMETKESFENNAAYCKSWLKPLKDDPLMIIHACSKADKAVLYILGNNDNTKGKKDKSERKVVEGNNSTTKEKVTKKEGETTAKKARRSHDQVIIDRIAKDAKKYKIKCADGWSQLVFNYKNYCAFTDGHRIMAGKSNFGYGASKEPLKTAPLFKPYENEGNLEYVEIDIKDVKAKCKELKASRLPYIIDDGKNRMGVNPQYLIDALEFCKTDILWYEKPNYKSCIKHPLFFSSEGKDRVAIVCPVNIN